MQRSDCRRNGCGDGLTSCLSDRAPPCGLKCVSLIDGTTKAVYSGFFCSCTCISISGALSHSLKLVIYSAIVDPWDSAIWPE